MYVLPGVPLFVECEAKSQLPLNYKWSLNESSINVTRLIGHHSLLENNDNRECSLTSLGNEEPFQVKPREIWYMNQKTVTGRYVCLAYNQDQVATAAFQVKVATKPNPPDQVTVECWTTDRKTAVAKIQWSADVSFDLVSGFRIEMVFGVDRQTRNTTNPKPDEQKDHITRSRLLASNAVTNNHWMEANHLIEFFKADGSIDRAGKIKYVAKLVLNGDAVYNFRLFARNVVGLSDPSPVTPSTSIMGSSPCYVPALVATELPEDLYIYGTSPGTLIVSWPVVPKLKWNGSKFVYHLKFTCLDCIDKHVGWTWDEDGDDDEEFLVEFTTVLNGAQKGTRSHQIEIFREYQVSMTTSNIKGSDVKPPLIRSGYSGEGVPDISVEGLTFGELTSNDALIRWRYVDLRSLDKWCLGVFRGFRVHYCRYDSQTETCVSPMKYQDYMAKEAEKSFFEQRRLAHNHETRSDTELNVRSSKQARKEANSLKYVKIVEGKFEARIEGLPEYSLIKITVSLMNIRNVGPQSDPIFIQTLQAIPGYQIELSANDSATLKWKHGAWLPKEIVTYKLIISEVPSSVSKVVTNEEPLITFGKPYNNRNGESNILVNGLAKNTEYVISLWLYDTGVSSHGTSLGFKTTEANIPPDIRALNLSVQCLSNNDATALAILRWKMVKQSLGNVVKPSIQWVVGYDRNGYDVPEGDTFENRSQFWSSTESHNTRIIAINRALDADSWRTIPENALVWLGNESSSESDEDFTVFKAVVSLSADAAYHFRLRFENQQKPFNLSEVVPPLQVNSDELCYVPPKPVDVHPSNIAIYGVEPDSIIIELTPIPELLQNGPGLNYEMKFECLSCKNHDGFTIFVGKCERRFELNNHKSKGNAKMLGASQAIRGFQMYKVTVKSTNYFGNTPNSEISVFGYSGEHAPNIIANVPEMVEVLSNMAVISWSKPEQFYLDTHIKGFFRGFRLSWCRKMLFTQPCDADQVAVKYTAVDLPTASFADNRIAASGEQRIYGAVKQMDRGDYHALVVNLPEWTEIQMSANVLNVQYMGSASSPLSFMTMKSVPKLHADIVGSDFVKISWDHPFDSDNICLIKLYEEFNLPSITRVGFDVQEFDRFPCSKPNVWVFGLKPNGTYRVSVRIEHQAQSLHASALLVKVNESADGIDALPLTIEPSMSQLGSVRVCLVENFLTCKICGSHWGSSSKENRMPYNLKSASIDIGQKSQKPTMFRAELRAGPLNNWLLSDPTALDACVTIGDIKLDSQYETRVVIIEDSRDIWTSKIHRLDIAKLIGVDQDQYAIFRLVIHPKSTRFFNLTSVALILGLCGMISIIVYDWFQVYMKNKKCEHSRYGVKKCCN